MRGIVVWVTTFLLLTQLVHFLSGKNIYIKKKIKEKMVVLPASDISNGCLASEVVAKAKQMLTQRPVL